MDEEYVKITRDTYDDLADTRQELDNCKFKLSNYIGMKLHEADALGFKHSFTEKGEEFYTLVKILYKDEELLKLKRKLSDCEIKNSDYYYKLNKIPSWIRKLFKAD